MLYSNFLLLLLSCFSRVRLCSTPQTAAHQAPPSLGFSRQEHWSGLHFLLQCMKGKRESEVTQSCPTLSDPVDRSLPGSSVPGIFQEEYWNGVPLPNLLAIYLHMVVYTFQCYSLNSSHPVFPPLCPQACSIPFKNECHSFQCTSTSFL